MATSPPPPLESTFLTSSSPWRVPVLVIEETGSSNEDLLLMGENGAPAGTIIFAESQTAGRGQFKRPWASASRMGLWFSLLLRLEICDATMHALSAFASVAIMETLGELGISGACIKPPNDILVGGSKIAGVLVETRTGRLPFAVVGIGFNVNHAWGDFPPELRKSATSLAILSDSQWDRNQVAARILNKLAERGRQTMFDRKSLLSDWESMLCAPSAP